MCQPKQSKEVDITDGPKSSNPDSRRLLPTYFPSKSHFIIKCTGLLPGTKLMLWSPARQGGAHGGRWTGRGRATSRSWVWGLKNTLLGLPPRSSSLWPHGGTCPLLSTLTGYTQKIHFAHFKFFTSIQWV